MSRLEHADEEGAIAVIVALILTALLGIAMLTVDLGGLLVMKRKLVNAADAGALAAAQWCAETEGALAQSSSAQAHADGVAKLNVAGAAATRFDFTAGSLCPGPSGEVTVEYQADKDLYFAPALGLGDSRPVASEAVGIWGPAGAADDVVPVMVNVDRARADCGIPDGEVGARCAFWYNNGELGDAQWGFLDLSNWDVAPTYNCPNAGAAPRNDWISDGFPESLVINYPDPTYVCTTSGVANVVWETLRSQAGEVLTFPVNDPATQLLPPPETPEKYNIVGFTSLKLIAIYDGNDAEAIGTSAESETCSTKIDFGITLPLNELYLDGLGCYSDVPASITNLTLVGKTKPDKGKPETLILEEGSDYIYNATLRKVTWLRPEPMDNVDVSFVWANPGTSGACEPPERRSDPNAKCIVAEWVGFTTDGIEPGGGLDLGVRAIRLSG